MPSLTHAYLLAALAAVCWGVVVVPIKLARISGRLGIGISLTTGSLVMLCLSGREMVHVFDLPRIELLRYALTGTLQFTAGCMFYYESIRRGSVSVAVPITRVKNILILFLSIAIGLETFRWSLLGACLLVVLGGALVGLSPVEVREDATRSRAHRDSLWLAAGTCLCWTFGETLIGTLPKQIGPIASNGLILCAGCIVYWLYALASGTWRQFRTVPRRDALCYVAHGVVSFSLAYVLYVSAVKLASPPRINCITAPYPLISAMLGWLIFKERLSWNIALGAALLAAGVILLQFA